MTVSETFGRNMKGRRLDLGLTQKQLGQMLGYSEKSVSKWESGDTIPPGTILPNLAEILRVSIDDLFCKNDEPSYFLGIDGGGTKTEFWLTDAQGNVIQRATLGESNPVDIGLQKAFEVLEKGIMQVYEGISPEKISVFAGIAGGISGDNKNKIAAFLKGFRFGRCDNDSDAKIAVKAALGDGDGIAVILGTGDIAFTQKNGTLYRTGGFGYLFDEGGSGYSIGRDAILACLTEEQLALPGSVLSRKLKEHYKTDCFVSVITEFYSTGKKKIASASEAVFEAYKEGDSKAIEIIERNFKAAAKLICDASRFFDNETISVSLAGSVSKNDSALPMIEKYLKELGEQKLFDLSVCQKPPVIGALALAGLKEEIKNA